MHEVNAVHECKNKNVVTERTRARGAMSRLLTDDEIKDAAEENEEGLVDQVSGTGVCRERGLSCIDEKKNTHTQ